MERGHGSDSTGSSQPEILLLPHEARGSHTPPFQGGLLIAFVRSSLPEFDEATCVIRV